VKFALRIVPFFLLAACAFAAAGATGAAVDTEAQECLSYTRAPEKAGEIACITGKVVEVHTTRTGVTYLNFCRDYRDCGFSVVVLGGDARRLGDLRILRGREIRITGKVTSNGRRAEMRWQTSGQVLVATDDEKPKKK
jgi:hypothetical protein